MIGRILNSRYRIEERIGSGGMADVYKATDTLLGRTVAVKILHTQFSRDPVFIERFRQEAQAAANLNQPNIVNVFDWGVENGTHYLVMEYVQGRDLKDIILQGGPLLPERAVEIAVAICRALDSAHEHGVVHRDIKPQNIIATYDNQIKVMDFGIARTAGGSAMTQTGTIMGTAQYLSPEQAQGKSADPRSDLYSLGIVLYEMLTGKVPFDGENPVSIAYKHVREDPLPPSMINPDISAGLESVIMKALAKNPENRYRNAMEMCSDLERCLEGAPVNATPVMSREEAFSGATRAFSAVDGPAGPSRTWLWTTVIIVVLLAFLGIAIWAIAKDSGGVKVPDLTGMTVDEATAVLEPLGLKIEVAREVASSSHPAGAIVRQDPKAGDRMDKGGIVKVQISKGGQTEGVPNVVGKTRKEAESILTGIGFKVAFTEQFSNDYPAGTVVSQTPAAGEEAEEGSTITLVISKGAETVTVPNVEGLSEADAVAALEKVGLAASVVNQETSDSSKVGKVLTQDPKSGQKANKGSAVTITVGTEAHNQVEVPNVVGQSKTNAINNLQSKGFQVSVSDGDSTASPSLVGTVQSQSPLSGSMAKQGSTVIVYIYIAASP